MKEKKDKIFGFIFIEMLLCLASYLATYNDTYNIFEALILMNIIFWFAIFIENKFIQFKGSLSGEKKK